MKHGHARAGEGQAEVRAAEAHHRDRQGACGAVLGAARTRRARRRAWPHANTGKHIIPGFIRVKVLVFRGQR